MKRALVIWFFVAALVAMGCSPPPDNLDSVGSVATLVDSDPGAIQLLGDHTDAGTMVASGVLSTPYARQLARTSDGALYCVYYHSDGAYTQIYGSKSVDGGQTWTEEQITTAPLYHYQPSIAIDSDDNLHVAWIVFPDGDPIDQSYGYLWPGYPGHPGRVSTVQYRVKTTGWQSIENVKTGYHTVLSMALDSDDNVHLAIAGHNPGAWNCAGISYARRTASGWDPVERISSGCWTGVAAIAVDVNNNAHVVWPHRPYGDGRTEIIYRQRTSSGWENEVQLQSFDNYWSGGLSIATDSSNQIHVVWGWQERQGDHYGIRYRRFTTYWHPKEMIEGPTLLLQNMPTIAIDGNDHIHVIWSGRHVDSPDILQLRYREYASAWQQTENLTSSTSDDQANPNLMWASHPAVAGVKTNQMEEGYSLAWMDGTTIRYWSSTLIVDYDLTIASTEGGEVTDPGENTFTYKVGTVVDLVATSEEGWTFVEWTGDVDTIADVYAAETSITMDGYYAIMATFTQSPVNEIDVTKWELTNLYETSTIHSFFGRVMDLVGDTVWCQVDVYVTGDEFVDDIEITVASEYYRWYSDLNKEAPGHYRAELRPGRLDLKQMAFNIIALFAQLQGATVVGFLPAPEFVMSRITIFDTNGEVHNITQSLSGQSLPEKLPNVEDAIKAMLPGPWSTQNGTLYGAFSPIDLLVIDSHGRSVGALYEDGVFVDEVNEIPNAVCWGRELECRLIFIPDSSGGNTVQVVGVQAGDYALYVLAFAEGEADTLTATGIPTSPSAVHEYTIDWEALARGEKGVTLQVDADGDGTPNYTLTAGSMLTAAATVTATGTAFFAPSHGVIEGLEAVPIQADPPTGIKFPHGMFSFNITEISPGDEVAVTIYLPEPVPVGTRWWKHQNGEWYSLPNDTDDGDNTMTITLTDGGLGDADRGADGIITDPGGPGYPLSLGYTVGWETQPINKSAVSAPWIGLLAAIAGASLLVLRRRQTQS